MRKEHIVEHQGRSFVLYAGLIDEATEKGLKSIRTELLQSPLPENGETTICQATVEMGDGRVFQGIGDANPTNVGRQIAPHAIRMAETRSKARALRDALNIGAVALEELGDLDEPDPDAQPRHRSGFVGRDEGGSFPASSPTGAPTPIERARAAAPGRPPASGAGRDDLATPAQVRAIFLIGRDQHSMSDADVEERSRALYGRTPAELSRREASNLITSLKGGQDQASS
jgi:hypothetical protein